MEGYLFHCIKIGNKNVSSVEREIITKPVKSGNKQVRNNKKKYVLIRLAYYVFLVFFLYEQFLF